VCGVCVCVCGGRGNVVCGGVCVCAWREGVYMYVCLCVFGMGEWFDGFRWCVVVVVGGVGKTCG
jgi:hypothetical protein